MKIRIKQVDAFTTVPLTGNPAGVVVRADGLTEAQMQAVARELAVSETAFILPATAPEADLRIRWFTPTVEVPLCGHATVAGFHALAEERLHGMETAGSYRFRLETRSGILPVTVEKGPAGAEIAFGLPVPEFTRAGHFKLDLVRILNIPLEEFEPRMPIVTAGYLYAPVRRLHTLFGMRPNFAAMTQFLTNKTIPGVCVFSTETIERGSAVHSRFFAPTVGIPEDPVTGSANGPLGVYLFDRGEVQPSGGAATLIGEQGDPIGRRGRVTIRLTVEGSRVVALSVGGRAVTVVDGDLTIA